MNAPNGLKLGEVMSTRSGTLPCQRIFHGVLCKWDGGKGKAEKVLMHYEPTS